MVTQLKTANFWLNLQLPLLTLLMTSYLESSSHHHTQGLPPPLPLWTLQCIVCKQIQNYIFKPIQNDVVIIKSGCRLVWIYSYQWDQSWLPAYMSNRKQETLTAMRSANNSKFPLWRGRPKNWPIPACGSSHCGLNCISTNPLQHFLHSNHYIVLNLYRITFSKLMLWVRSCM